MTIFHWKNTTVKKHGHGFHWNGESHDLYGKPDIIRIVKSRRLRWTGHVTRIGNENKELLEEFSFISINHDLREVDYTGDDWKTLAGDREVWRAYVHAAMNLRVR